MWEVVPLEAIILVWSLGAVHASYDGIADYWYSNDDGIILDSLAPLTLYRSNNYNKSSNLRTQSYNDSIARQEKQRGKSEWVLQFEKHHSKHRADDYLRAHTPSPFRRDPILDRLQRTVTPAETWRCAIGPDKILEDGCNHCVCLGGQLYLCTAKKCQTPEPSGVLVYRTYREKKRDRCIEGEKIKSFDCNKCWCSGGKIICTVRTCSKPNRKPYHGRPMDDENQRCEPGEPQPSRDNCNTCGCNKRGQKYCSAMTCGIIPRTITDRDVGCVPQTWYSLDGSDACKECYCVDGKMGICYMKLCKGTLANKGYAPQKLMASIKTSTCKKGAVMFDECSKCICTYKEEWRCYTRLIDKCGGQERETLNSPSQGSKNIIEAAPSKNRFQAEKAPANNIDSNEDYEPIESVEIDNTVEGVTRRPKGQKKSPVLMEDYEETPDSHGFHASDGSPGDVNLNSQKKEPNGIHDKIDDPLYDDEDVTARKFIRGKKKHPSDNRGNGARYDSTTTRYREINKRGDDTDSAENGDETDGGEDEEVEATTPSDIEITDKMDEVTAKPWNKQQAKKIPPRGTTKRRGKPLRPTRRPKIPGRPDKHELPPGTQCIEGESFTQGVTNNCQGCVCTAQGQWKCFSARHSCREINRCWIGVYEKNKRTPCSVCYCGQNGTWMCFTDEACAQQITKSSCDAIECSNGCRTDRWIYGFCHRDKCVCV